MLRKLAVRLLLRILAPGWSFHNINDEGVTEWLALQSQDQRFQDYIRTRDLTLLKTFGSNLDRERYQNTIGQRIEVLILMAKVAEAQEYVKKRNAKRLRDAERKAAEERAKAKRK